MRQFKYGFALSLTLAACNSNSSSNEGKPITPESTAPAAINPGAPIGGDSPVVKPPTIPVSEPSAEKGKIVFGLSTSKTAFLLRVGEDIARRSLLFKKTSEEFKTTIEDFCQDPNPDAKLSQQNAWRNLMLQWQHFELYQLGPIAENNKSLKSSIYGWPDPANYCKIDEEALKAVKNPSYTLAPNNNRKGMQALEYLLFENSLASRCKLPNPVAKEWNGLSQTEIWQARCAYLKPLARDLSEQATTLADSWGAPNDNSISRILGNQEQENKLIQQLYENIFFIDLEVKNRKLAAPAGQDIKFCPQAPAPCLDREEFQFSNFSRLAINENIRAFVDLIFGPGVDRREGGFSALIRAAAHPEIADRSEALAASMDQLITEDSELSLKELIVKHAQESCETTEISLLCRLRSKIRSFAADLKTEYVAILKLKAPEAAQGDND